jgi:hypothetical protein
VPRGDDGPPQPLHVVEQVLAARLAEYLAEQVAEQADVPAHRRRHVLAVGVPAHQASVATAAQATVAGTKGAGTTGAGTMGAQPPAMTGAGHGRRPGPERSVTFPA